MKWLSLLMLSSAILCGCASIRPTGMGERTYIKPDGVRYYSSLPCSKELVDGAHTVMLNGGGHAGLAMYYYRCRGPNEHKQYLKNIRLKGRAWWIKHRPRKDNE